METDTPGARHRPRAWLIGLLGLAVVALVAYQMWPHESAATPVIPSSNLVRSVTPGDPKEAFDPAELKVNLESLQAKRPDPGEVERNPFRFRPPPAPPSPKLLPPQVPAGPPPPPLPPPIPPIPLRFMGTVEGPGIKLAALTDCKGFTYQGREGEPIDGRYTLVRIGQESIVMEYLNGTGRTTIRKSGECPK